MLRAGAALLAVCALASNAGAQTIEVPEFEVGSSTVDLDLAAGADGAMLFIWTDYSGGTGAAKRVYTRQFSASGTPLTSPTRIDESGRLSHTRLAAFPGGGYVASFARTPASGADTYHSRILDSSGAPAGDIFRVDGETLGSARFGAVVGLSAGPAFVWYEHYTWARLFTMQGVPRTDPIQMGGQACCFDIDAAATPGGGFAAVWEHSSIDYQTHGRIFDANGTPLTPALLLGAGLWGRLAVSPTGGLALVYAAGSPVHEIWVSRFSSTGAPQGSPVLVADVSPARYQEMDLDFDAHGNILVVWSALNLDNSRTPVFGRVLDGPTSVPVGGAVQLAPAGYHARTVRLQNGNFAVTWVEQSGARANVVSICGLGSPTCGDGVVDPPCEACDDGAGNSDTTPGACRTSCRLPGCGDTVIDPDEECDDGGRTGGDGCDNNCLVEQCGNGRRESNESCDDGNLVDGDGCDSNCTFSGCGNGILGGAEECEDGNTVSGDGCDANCLIEECGNSRTEAAEECDDGNLVEGDGCDTNCTLSRCGNGILGIDEECDDGNAVHGDGCDQACQIEACGNGRRETNESCDDGNLEDGDGCQADCRLTPVVDGTLAAPGPLTAVLPTTTTETTKTVRLTVRNPESSGLQILRLTAGDGSCPAGTVVSPPDFSASIDGAQDTVALSPGQTSTAKLPLRLARATMPGVHSRAPRRCQIELSIEPGGGAVDSRPSNNTASLVVDVYDRAAPGTGVIESYARSAKPLSLRIPNGSLAIERTVTLVARSTETGASFSFAADEGDCPPGTVSLIEQSPSGRARLRVRAARAFYTSTSLGSPDRCTAFVTETTAQDTDAGNNTTPLVIDVVDLNDL